MIGWAGLGELGVAFGVTLAAVVLMMLGLGLGLLLGRRAPSGSCGQGSCLGCAGRAEDRSRFCTSMEPR